MKLEELIKQLKSYHPNLKEKFESNEYKRSRFVFCKRIEHGLTQQQLALKAGVSPEVISRIEGADVGIRYSALRKVLGVL